MRRHRWCPVALKGRRPFPPPSMLGVEDVSGAATAKSQESQPAAAPVDEARSEGELSASEESGMSQEEDEAAAVQSARRGSGDMAVRRQTPSQPGKSVCLSVPSPVQSGVGVFLFPLVGSPGCGAAGGLLGLSVGAPAMGQNGCYKMFWPVAGTCWHAVWRVRPLFR